MGQLMKIRNCLVAAAVAGLMAGCAVVPPEAPKKDLTEPEMARLTDPNPFANYAPAMVSSAEFPLTVNWQDAHKDLVAEATRPEALAAFLKSDAAAAELLAGVKEAYRTEPIVMIRIAAVSQLVMCPRSSVAPSGRATWTAALLAAAREAPDAYRAMLFLDQLRWCGRAEDAAAVREIGKASGHRAVEEFAEQVAKEIAP